MRRLKAWINSLQISQKLIFYIYLILIPVLFVSALILSIVNYHREVKEEREISTQAVRALSDTIEGIQRNATQVGDFLTVNAQVQSILERSAGSENSRYQMWEKEAPMQEVQDFSALSGTVRTIALYPENGLPPYTRCFETTVYLPSIELCREQEIYREAVDNPGDYLIRRVESGQGDTYLTNRRAKVVFYRELYSLDRKTPLGYMVIGTDAEEYDQLCENTLQGEGSTVWLLSPDCEILSRTGKWTEDVDWLRAVVPEERYPAPGEVTSVLTTQGGERYRIYLYTAPESRITVVRSILDPGAEIFARSLFTAMLMLAALLLGLFPVVYLISANISRPLMDLARAMEYFKRGDFTQRVEVRSGDEVGKTSAVFNEMVEDMKELIDQNYVITMRQQQSEFDALQAQINPHFLYNALDTLYWKILESGNNGAAEDVLALSDLFRLVLAHGEAIVPVGHECALLENYLHIQKTRFGERLSYEVEVSREAREEKIPKLILQPFVENAIVHGFEKGKEAFLLRVIGEKREDRLYFEIRDTGVGMTPEQVERIWQEDLPEYAGQRIGRYAIRNVRERLDLQYHGDFSLEIESKIGEGTVVRISVPTIINREVTT